MSEVHSVKNVVGKDRVPDYYEGYLYRYTCNDSGRWYAGVHQGFVEDGYHHSSSCEEFNEIFSDPDANLTLEYLAFGDYETMTAKEHNLLKRTNARENPESFNKSYGSPLIHEIDNNSVEELLFRIENGEFENNVNVNIDELFELARLQVRDEDDDNHIRHIRDRIDDAGGSTAKCARVTVLQGRGANNTDILMDGNHTVAAARMAKRATTLLRNLIPKETHQQYSDGEIRAVALALNPVEEFIKKPSEVADMVKHIVNNLYGKGLKWDTTNTRAFLKRVGFPGPKITKIMTKARLEIADLEDLKTSNKIWKNYKTERFEDELQKTELKYTNDDRVVLVYSSAAFDWRKLVDNWRKYRDGKDVVVIVHHPRRHFKEAWDKKNHAEIELQLDYFLRESHGINVTIIEMETQCVNEIEMDNAA